MTSLCCDVLKALSGKTLVTAESCTGGGIGAALTSISGSSAVYMGGIISYTNDVKAEALGVSREVLTRHGAVSAPVAAAMANGVRRLLHADVAVSVTGLAGPGGDDFGNPVGTVFIAFADGNGANVRECRISGSRDAIRNQTVRIALELVLEMMK